LSKKLTKLDRQPFLIDEIEFFSLYDQKFDFGGDGWSFDRRERYE